MTSGPFESWLRQHRRDRTSAGLIRELVPRAADGPLVDLAGNDYLGLRRDPRVTAAAAQAAIEWGAGAGASRLVNGSLAIHADLEHALAEFTGRPAALVLSTGYHANLSAITALSDPDTLVISDAHVHASLVDACRLARHGGLRIVGHNDVEEVRAALRDRNQRRALILVESVYSVLGDSAPLKALAAAADEFDAVLVVDEAHALGVSGTGGRGLVHASGLAEQGNVVVTATLSKALGSQGGAVIASAGVIEHLVNSARPFIYDTGLAPSATGAALTAVRIVAAEPQLPRRARDLADRMATALDVRQPAGSVLSVEMASAEHALRTQAEFAADGYAVGCFRPPSVPDGVSRIRLTAKASLRDADVYRILDRLRQVVQAR
jgi:8-amino-7-oxononanoate synthase